MRIAITLFLILGFSCSVYAQDASSEIADLQIMQRVHREYSATPVSSGQKKDSTSILLIKEDRLRIDDINEDNKTQRSVIVRFDTSLIWDINVDENTYTEKSFSEVRKEMAKMESDTLEHISTLPKEQGEELRLLYGLGETSIRANTLRSKKTGKPVEKEIVAHTCTRITVFENERPKVRAWISTDIKMPMNPTRVLEVLGVFSNALSLAVRENLKGFPLELKVSAKRSQYEINAHYEVERIKEVPEGIPLSKFNLPPNCKRVEAKKAKLPEGIKEE